MGESIPLGSDGHRSVRLSAPELLEGWELVSDLSPDRAVLIRLPVHAGEGSAVTAVICFVAPEPGGPEPEGLLADAPLQAIPLGRSVPVGTASQTVSDEVQVVPSTVEPVVQLTRRFRLHDPDADRTVEATVSLPVHRLEEIAPMAQALLDALEVV